jgi:tetratricopeptide (TPR) repeat protein
VKDAGKVAPSETRSDSARAEATQDRQEDSDLPTRAETEPTLAFAGNQTFPTVDRDAETIAMSEATTDNIDPHATAAFALPTLDSKDPSHDLKLTQPKSLKTLSTAAPIQDGPFIGEIGDYLLIQQIGRGGMGVVYKAYQKKVGRTVALKVIAAGSLCAPEDIARFHDEATAAGRLNHSGIVPVYDAGEHNGTHYFSMAYIEGESLAAYVGRDKPRLPPRKVAKLIAQVCRAVQYAHDRAVIHRDIKPANIMVDKSGQPLLTDFGLAKLIGNEGLTMTGQVMGTPNYMAPEQARGAQELISTRTDVYSLGATLYALLAGIPAFVGKNLIETLRKVESAAPTPLAFKGSPVPLDLWTICEKCLAKNPDDRYESAGALADDLERFLNGFPIAARAVGPFTRLQRWCARNPVTAALIAGIAATLVIATIVSVNFGVRAQASQARAEENLTMIEQLLEEVLGMSESKLADVPGTQHIREELLATAQKYYDDLNAKQQVSPAAVTRAAFSLGRMQASLRQYEEARKSFDEVLAYQAQQVAAQPSDAELAMALARTHYEYAKLGERIWNERDLTAPDEEARAGLADMLTHAGKCTTWRAQAHNLAPENRAYARLLANATMGLGLAQLEQQQLDKQVAHFDEAEELIESSQAMREKLIAVKQDDGAVQADLARGYIALADLRVAEAQAPTEAAALDEAIDLRKQAIAVFENLPAEAITMDTRFDLANCYQSCGSDYANGGDYEQAEEYFIKMGETLQPELLSNPGVYKLRKGVADAQYNLAQIALIQSDTTGLDYIYDCQKNLVNALIVDPRNHDAIQLMLDYTTNMVDLLVQADSYPEAIRALEDAKTLLNEAKSSSADIEFIESTVNDIDQRIEDLRKQRNAEERTA